MKELISHIEFLILQNDYVVIPDFGGFVLNREVAIIDENGVFLPPFIRLGFNADLKHNDGLLAESYMKTLSVSYEIACDKISMAVKELRANLLAGKNIECGILGGLKYADKHVIFEANTHTFRHPSVWGLSPLGLCELDKMSMDAEETTVARSTVWLRRSIAVATSAVAAFALFCLPVSDDSTVFSRVQQSGFFVNYKNYSVKSVNEKTIVPASRTSSVIEDYITQVNTEQEILAEKIRKGIVKPPKCYYIVIGGESDKSRAFRMLASFQGKGFKDARVIESPSMYRIYVASFMDKDEANAYLDSFRMQNPAYNDAWLFTKRQEIQ